MVQVADVSVIEHQMLRLGSTNSVSAWLSAGMVGAVCSGVDSGSDVDADVDAAGSALGVGGLFTTCITIRTRNCLLYTSDAADEEDSVDLGGRRIIKKKKKK